MGARAGADGGRAAARRDGRAAGDGVGGRTDPGGSAGLSGPALPPDAELLAALAGGDDGALEALYDRYSRPAYALALGIVRDPALAQDAVQEAFLGVWRSAASFDAARASVQTWLLTLVHRRAVDIVRREQRRRSDPIDPEQAPPAGVATEEEAWLRERRRTVQAALRQLPDDQRQALELAYYGGLSQSELAERLGVPLGTVKSRMFAALSKLRDLLAEVNDV